VTGRLVAVGDNVVDRYQDRAVMYPGGNAVNVAVHARRCGVDSAYLGAVGTDAAGRAVLRALEQEGVDTSLTRVVNGPNAYATVRVVEGNRVFGSSDVGVSRFRLSASDLDALRAFDVVHSGECSMVEDQLSDLADVARLLSFDFSERPWDYIEKHARHADVAIRSMPATHVTTALAQARRLADLGPRIVAVTLGPGGAVVLHGDRWVHAPAPPADVVDTLGAGDAFIARLLVGLVADTPLDELVRRATEYASASCTSFGAFGYATPDVGPDPGAGPDRASTALAPAGGPAAADRTTPLDPIQHGGVDQR
jgi:fructoselysine 6-kinase